MTRLGVIAEGDSDVEVVEILARKIARRPFTVKSAIGKGCGRLQKKALDWARQLHAQECTRLMLVCDLDDNSVADLTARLTRALAGCPIARSGVVIPVREIEAWLLADQDAVSDAFKLRQRIKPQSDTEAIRDPKGRLGDLIAQRSNRRVQYVSTVHNRRIAEQARVERLRRCASFTGFEAFVRRSFGVRGGRTGSIRIRRCSTGQVDDARGATFEEVINQS